MTNTFITGDKNCGSPLNKLIMKKQPDKNSDDIDKALAIPGTASTKGEQLHTENPIAEKDEEKKAEDKLRTNVKRNGKS